LEAIHHPEGRITITEGTPIYEYVLRDHLGNGRVYCTKPPLYNDPIVLQENHYYPFGMNMDGPWTQQQGEVNRYQYNGKELNEEFGLGWNDYGARWYDASIGRWTSVDPLAEKYKSFSPYNYTMNNPIRFIDPNGKFVIDPSATRKERRALRQAIRKVKKFVKSKKVLAAVSTFGQLNKKQLKADLKKGKGPLLKVSDLKTAYGRFRPGKKSKELQISKGLLNKQNKAKGSKKKDYKFLTAVTILHENTHRGDDLDGKDFPGEEGNKMEKASFGVVVDEGNMRLARKKFKKFKKK